MSIELSGITKRFGAFVAVDGVDLHVETGELLALLGPSGSGKTSLLRIIAGLEAPDAGTVAFHGEDATDRHARERRVGFVFQHYALFGHLTIFENVAFGLRVRPRAQRLTDAQIRQKVTTLLELVQLDALADRHPRELSGGQRQRIALARALAVEPRVLLLDEPFGALDARVRQELRRWLRRLHDEVRLTSVFVTHDQEEALSMSDQIAVMNAGSLEQVGTPREIYAHTRSRFVADFLGAMNWIDGIGVRPEAVSITSQGRNASVTNVSYLGSFCRIEMKLETGEVIAALAPPGTSYTTGQAVCFTWNREDEIHL